MTCANCDHDKPSCMALSPKKYRCTLPAGHEGTEHIACGETEKGKHIVREKWDEKD